MEPFNHTEQVTERLMVRMHDIGEMMEFISGERRKRLSHEIACIAFELSLRGNQ